MHWIDGRYDGGGPDHRKHAAVETILTIDAFHIRSDDLSRFGSEERSWLAAAMRVFDPWVGSQYWTEGLSGVRVLLLGESHYGDPGAECPTFTADVVRAWGQEKRNRFFTVVQKMLTGLGPDDWVSDERRREFWERVAFYNFVQAFPGAGPRSRPSAEMWSAATNPFLVTVEELQPQVLVVLGYELQSYLPPIPNSIVACGVQHPSSRGFRYGQWQAMIQAALHSAAARDGA